MARFIELTELFEELEKITSLKKIVRKIANFFSGWKESTMHTFFSGV